MKSLQTPKSLTLNPQSFTGEASSLKALTLKEKSSVVSL
jgi:hypothetical protein